MPNVLTLEVFLGRLFGLISKVKTLPYANARNLPSKADFRIFLEAVP
jgi:hypothetical protein